MPPKKKAAPKKDVKPKVVKPEPKQEVPEKKAEPVSKAPPAPVATKPAAKAEVKPVEKVVIERSSGSKALDEAAKNIVMLAAPFAEFSQKMRNEVDIINISRSWKFTNSSKLIKN